MRKKVLVGMSGGVDSSLTAALLQSQGYEVIGVTMFLENENCHERSCCSSKEIEDASKVADFLGIKFYIANFRSEFKKNVVNYFVEEYLKGRTPNPCVVCNKKIKFGKLFEYAKEQLDADYLATGHYARIIFEDGRYKLKKAVDLKKDQSYVLYNLTPDKLAKILLPLGTFSKVETRKLADEMNLPVADKPDSQEICFVPNDDYKSFLKDFAPNADALKAGNIVDSEGKILGSHKGVANYTIGQRKGLGIAAPQPLYVTHLDVENKKVVVETGDKLFSNRLTANNVHWIYKPNLPKNLSAKIRYGSKIYACTVFEDENFLRVNFNEPVRAITPGQSVVFYDDDELIGGGIIESAC